MHTHIDTHMRTCIHTHPMFSSACCHGDMDTACTPVPQSAELNIIKLMEAFFAFIHSFYWFFLVIKIKDVKALKLESICASQSRRISLTRPNICSQLLPAIHIPVNWWLRNFFAIESCCAQGYKHTHTHTHTHTHNQYCRLVTWHLRFFWVGFCVVCVCVCTHSSLWYSDHCIKKIKQCQVVFL